MASIGLSGLAIWWFKRARWGAGCDRHGWLGVPCWLRWSAQRTLRAHLRTCPGPGRVLHLEGA